MHRRYGPIVRINPREIHIDSPEFYDTIYTRNEKREIWDESRVGFGTDVSTVVTVDHDLHRKRRSAMIPMFAQQRIYTLQHVIQERVDMLMSRIHQAGEQGETLNMKLGYAAFTAETDVAMKYFFGKHQNKVESPDFDFNFHNAIEAGFHKMAFHFHLPWIMKTARVVAHYTPARVLRIFMNGGGMASFIAAQRQIHIQTKEALQTPLDEKKDGIQKNLFEQILASRLPPSEKSFERLAQEGGLMVSAATVSTAWALTSATFLLLTHPTTLRKLKDELRSASVNHTASDESYDLAALEKLPYIQAVIQESIRIGVGPSRRSPRISPESDIIYTDSNTGKVWTIPPRTPVTMSQPLLMRHEKTFPDPYAFRPERWMETPGLDKYQVAFSKGSRACPGITLATAEMKMMLAAIFSRYGSSEVSDKLDTGVLILEDTDRTDIECVGDGGIAYVKEGSEGVKIKVIPKP
ncbi:hypothetical protein N7478_012081 [Penicillium angulare]|uniref:uncharacterized protein n=1 Tax=Penicillium angulare TaxID=116970 RepID=UPI0025403A14|nr:uncharacterized protein N7478_012081 [Penicillium angulare]KAJ5260476.1 hypothetical protein N7478_012081 [Penicillium angulare]